MKRFFSFIIVIVILYFSYQGWLKYINQDDQFASTGQQVTDSTALTSSTLKDSLNQALGSMQSSVLSFMGKEDESDVPASTVKVSNSDEEVINQLATYLQNRDTQFVIDLYGERSHISNAMEGWIDAALAKDDYVRYALQSYSYSIVGYSQYSEVTFNFVYRETAEQTAYVKHFVKDLLEANGIANMNDHEKVKWINDWIVTHVQYDHGLTKYTAYEALTEKLAVCQGYALLGHMMLEEAGFEARIAEGEVNTGSHAWNMVKLDHTWYHIDFTWNDPSGQAEDEISYQYYLVSDDTLRKDHSWTKDYPVASVNYKDVLNHAIVSTTGTQQEALQVFQQSIDLHWYDDQYTIKSKNELVEAIASLTKHKEKTLSFRYLDSDSLITDLKSAFKSTNLALSYNVEYRPFSEDGDSLVTVTVTYN